MGKRIENAVVVITGAASGIGRVTAQEFAKAGARVVLTGRRQEALEDLAAQLGRDRALAVAADVTDENAVLGVADAAVERFGGIDVWVNVAAVTLFGPFEEVPHPDFRRVLEVNLLGYAHGAWAALPHLRASHGTLINVGSVNSYAPQPWVSAYIASKHAVRGWAAALRQELRGSGVDVVTILPASIDTPLFRQAANYSGRRPKALDPVNPPEKVAKAIVSAARRPRREKPVGRGAGQMIAMEMLMPPIFERLLARKVDYDHFTEEPAPPTDGNLYVPIPQWASATGGWRHPGKGTARAAAVALAAGGAAGITVLRRRRRGGRFPRFA
jgi:NAD(P)-dependent dehydrogenase (short-subunit alcohol dehydrogenase family)